MIRTWRKIKQKLKINLNYQILKGYTITNAIKKVWLSKVENWQCNRDWTCTGLSVLACSVMKDTL